MRFERGREKTGGRQRGVTNRFTGAFREAVQEVYNGLGGHEAFLDWAKLNQGEFYKICSRLIPVEIKGDMNTHTVTVHVHREPIEPVPVLPAVPLPPPDHGETRDGS